MMTALIDEDFLLENRMARRLYHGYAAQMPIFDYHCHLDAGEIVADRHFTDLTEIWLGADHYKWRLLRAAGVAEREITGAAPGRVKFQRWCETLPLAIGNPLYHWSHLELARCFDIDMPICPRNADRIWEQAGSLLRQRGYGARSFLTRFQVKGLCTTDDPADDLQAHRALAGERDCHVRVLPTFRPDQALHPENAGFAAYVRRLETCVGKEIPDFAALFAALAQRAAYFKQAGCVLADQSFDCPDFTRYDERGAQTAFVKARQGVALSAAEIAAYQSVLMHLLGGMYHRLGFAMQLHLGVVRNVHSRRYQALGADIGADTIGDAVPAKSLAALFDRLARENCLPRTILYSLQGSDREKLMALAGSFQDSECPGKMQVGSAWWFHDHADGIEAQLKSCANFGLLGGFIGMLTDSRSFLSYTRHEYFRRILCNLLGSWVERGRLPDDEAWLGTLVERICYENVCRYLGLDTLAHK